MTFLRTKIRSKSFRSIFILLVLLDLITGFIAFPELRQFSKPLILVSLIFFFLVKGRHLPRKIYRYTLVALCFSLMGDILLLYDHISSLYFMLGLIAFLIAHISYSIVFLRQGKIIFKRKLLPVTGLLMAYGITLFIILHNNLGSLKFPVIIYILGILLLAITAYSRKGRVNHLSFKLVFIGSLFFILSDSTLAINKFMMVIPGSHVLVMSTYAMAQYLMVRGILASNDRIYKRDFCKRHLSSKTCGNVAKNAHSLYHPSE